MSDRYISNHPDIVDDTPLGSTIVESLIADQPTQNDNSEALKESLVSKMRSGVPVASVLEEAKSLGLFSGAPDQEHRFLPSQGDYSGIREKLRASHSLHLEHSSNIYIRDAARMDPSNDDVFDGACDNDTKTIKLVLGDNAVPNEEQEGERPIMDRAKVVESEVQRVEKMKINPDRIQQLSKIHSQFTQEFNSYLVGTEKFYAVLGIAFVRRRVHTRRAAKKSMSLETGKTIDVPAKFSVSQFDFFDEWDDCDKSAMSLWNRMEHWWLKMKENALVLKLNTASATERERLFVGKDAGTLFQIGVLKQLMKPNSYSLLWDLIDCKDVLQDDINRIFNACNGVPGEFANLVTSEVDNRIGTLLRIEFARIAKSASDTYALDYKSFEGADNYDKIVVITIIFAQTLGDVVSRSPTGVLDDQWIHRAFLMAKCLKRDSIVCDSLIDVFLDFRLQTQVEKDAYVSTKTLISSIRELEKHRLQVAMASRLKRPAPSAGPFGGIEEWDANKLIKEKARLLCLIVLISPVFIIDIVIKKTEFAKSFQSAYEKKMKQIEVDRKEARERELAANIGISTSSTSTPVDIPSKLDLPPVGDIIKQYLKNGETIENMRSIASEPIPEPGSTYEAPVRPDPSTVDNSLESMVISRSTVQEMFAGGRTNRGEIEPGVPNLSTEEMREFIKHAKSTLNDTPK